MPAKGSRRFRDCKVLSSFKFVFFFFYLKNKLKNATPMSSVRRMTMTEELEDPFPSSDDVRVFLSNTSLSPNGETDGATILWAR